MIFPNVPEEIQLRGFPGEDEIEDEFAEITEEMWNNLNRSREVAVDPGYFWRPMSTCPRGVKVQLLNPSKVAVYGTYSGHDNWLGWAPLPKIKD